MALGGEYGGAAVYVAEHSPPGKRGFYTSFIQASVVGGFVLSLIVVLGCKALMPDAVWESWGWRVPFLLSLILLAISLWMRLKLSESPVFKAMKDQGELAKNPLKESFTYPGNPRRIFIALFGIAAGLTVIWYTAMFSGLSFLKGPMKVDDTAAEIIVGVAAAVGMGFFIWAGHWSDRVGRKKPIVWGYGVTLVLLFPLFWWMGSVANPSLQAYFRINAENMGQFERTLIIADEGSQVHYIEGCSAPTYTSDSLHSAVVEIVVKPSARVTYTTIQNWSNNVFNLVTKRARVEAEGHMEWIDGNIGSRLTMKYPAVWLVGPKASGEVLSVAYAGPGQHQDTGSKMVHAAPETTSKIVSKSISKDGGRTSYRGLIRVEDDAYGCKSHVQCDALILDDESTSDTYPYMEVGARDAVIGHEATVSKVADEQLFYLMSRGLSEEQAMGMVVNGFIEPVTRTLPMEYAVEWSRLIELQMEGSVG